MAAQKRGTRDDFYSGSLAISEMGRRKVKVPRVSRRTVANLRPEMVVIVPRRPWRGPVRT